MDSNRSFRRSGHPKTHIVGVCDLGTFTGLILVAEKVGREWITRFDERQTVDLASRASTTGRLSDAALRRAQRVVARFEKVTAEYRCEKAAVVCTAAVRDAANRQDFVSGLRRITSHPIRVLPPRGEARLSALGACIGLAPRRHPTVVVDIGGGSTELVVQEGKRTRYWLTGWGAARATNGWRRARHSHPSSEYCRLQAATIMEPLPVARIKQSFRVVGLGGTIVTLAAIQARLHRFDAARLHGMTLPRQWIEEMAERMASMNRATIAAMIPFDPARARVLTAGTFLWVAVLNRLCANSVTVSVRGLRWGVAAELAEKQPR